MGTPCSTVTSERTTIARSVNTLGQRFDTELYLDPPGSRSLVHVHGLERARLLDDVALDEVDAETAQRLERRLVLDLLGDDPDLGEFLAAASKVEERIRFHRDKAERLQRELARWGLHAPAAGRGRRGRDHGASAN